MEYKVLVTKAIPEEGFIELGKYAQIIMPSKKELFFTREKILGYAPIIHAVIVVGDRIDEEFLDSAKKLKVISVYGVGYDNVDVPAAMKRGITITNLPEAVTESTAELAFSLMLTLSRRIIEADQFVRQKENWNWNPFLLMDNNHELFKKKLGIIGMGRIGQAVARRAVAFGMEVCYYDIVRKEFPFRYLSFQDLITSVDYLSLHVPYLEKTHHMLGEKEFKAMKKSAYLINTSRGSVINEADLVHALREKEICGAALDVYENEPLVNPELRKLKNVVLSPHIGTGTIETRIKMTLEASENVIKIFRGEMPNFVVSIKGH